MTTLYRYRWIVLVVVGLALIGGAILSERSRRTGGQTVETKGGKRVAVRGQLGPTPGPDAEGYIAQKRAFLESAAKDDPARSAAGLVSLSRLLTAPDASRLAGTATVQLLFVRFPASDPEVLNVDGTIELAMGDRSEKLAGQLETEAAGYEQQAASATGAAKQDLQRLALEKRSAANTIKAGCACVYAMVLAGRTLAELATMQGAADVRLVDVTDPPVADLRGWELRPILPKS